MTTETSVKAATDTTILNAAADAYEIISKRMVVSVASQFKNTNTKCFQAFTRNVNIMGTKNAMIDLNGTAQLTVFIFNDFFGKIILPLEDLYAASATGHLKVCHPF